MERLTADVLRSSAGVPSFSSDTAQLAINGTANVYTHSQNISDVNGLVLGIVATVGSGTPDLDIYLQQSFRPPVTEGDAASVLNGWSQIGNNLADITAADAWTYVTLSPVTLPYMRILVDGQGANPATCKVGLVLGRQALID